MFQFKNRLYYCRQPTIPRNRDNSLVAATDDMSGLEQANCDQPHSHQQEGDKDDLPESVLRDAFAQDLADAKADQRCR